jgi:hypothetical protein
MDASATGSCVRDYILLTSLVAGRRRSSGTLPTIVQILVLAPLLGFSRIYRRYALSVSDIPVDDEAPSVTSGISRSVGAQTSEVLIGVEFAYVYS